MPANRTSGRLFLELIEIRIDRDKLQLEVDLLREQLRRHPAGAMQIREVERRLTQLRPELEAADDHGPRSPAEQVTPTVKSGHHGAAAGAKAILAPGPAPKEPSGTEGNKKTAS